MHVANLNEEGRPRGGLIEGRDSADCFIRSASPSRGCICECLYVPRQEAADAPGGSFDQSGVACLRQARVRLAGVKLAGLDRLGFVWRDFGGGTARVCLAEIACRFLEGVAGQRRCEPTLWLRNHCQLARLGDISALTLSQRMGICVGV
jgi:hypothetical protein